MVARKTITTIQEGNVYKERFVEPAALPADTTVRMVFKDSSGADVAEITGYINTQNNHYVEFNSPYADVADVPNGAGFYVYIHLSADDPADEHMIRYGTVFRRQLSFPDSPAISTQNLPRVYEDSFQRPPGSPGGRWKYLVGQPIIVSSGFAGILQFLLSFLFSQYGAYFMRYYVPFAGDTITLRVTLLKKGDGMTVIALDCSSDGSSYLYVGFNATDDTVELGRGVGPDISVAGNLIPEMTPVAHTVPSTAPGGNYKIRYDDVTKTLGLYNDDYTVEYATWTDTGNEVPHGKGYRYFAIGGTSEAEDSGIQVAYIKAQDDV
jgi:hypothetical protein